MFFRSPWRIVIWLYRLNEPVKIVILLSCFSSFQTSAIMMVFRILLLPFAFFIMHHCAAQGFSVTRLSEGTLLRTALPTAPFPAPQRAEGHDYGDEHYDDATHYRDSSVAIFIPKYLQAADSFDYIVHFHGWWNEIDSVLNTFDLIPQLTASGKNAILVVPQGPRKSPDSSGGKLEEPLAFKAFMSDVQQVMAQHLGLKEAPLRHIILSGHSGGYRVMSYILLQGGLDEAIKEVWLFDGLYGQLEKYAMWLERSKGRFINIYTPDGGTFETTLDLMNSLRGWDIQYKHIDDSNDVNPKIPEDGAVFWFTGLGHNEVLHARRYFYRLASTSRYLR